MWYQTCDICWSDSGHCDISMWFCGYMNPEVVRATVKVPWWCSISIWHYKLFLSLCGIIVWWGICKGLALNWDKQVIYMPKCIRFAIFSLAIAELNQVNNNACMLLKWLWCGYHFEHTVCSEYNVSNAWYPLVILSCT